MGVQCAEGVGKLQIASYYIRQDAKGSRRPFIRKHSSEKSETANTYISNTFKAGNVCAPSIRRAYQIVTIIIIKIYIILYHDGNHHATYRVTYLAQMFTTQKSHTDLTSYSIIHHYLYSLNNHHIKLIHSLL